VTNIDLKDIIYFRINLDFYEKHLLLPKDVEESLHNPSIIQEAETDVQLWMKFMERVRFSTSNIFEILITDRNFIIPRNSFQALVQSQQLRRETDVAGPSEELAYWRRLYTEFSSIMSQVESDYVKSFIQFLTEAKSKVIKVQEGHKFLILFLRG